MPILILLAQCLAMFAASVVAGNLPLMFKSTMVGRRLQMISTTGMGILVGAALTIIIPEGVSTLFASLPAEHDEREGTTMAIGLALLTGFALMLIIESLTPHPSHSPPSSPSSTPRGESPPPTSRRDSEEGPLRPPTRHQDSRTPIIPKRMHVRDGSDDVFHHDHRSDWAAGGGSTAGLNAVLGMVIHGAADGIALGASSLSGKGNLGLIVFLAVLVHKGPTALGLTTTLLSLGLTPPAIRPRVLIFSVAAPLGAVLTYALVKLFGHQGAPVGSGEIDALGWWIGIALLFSGGSFLYVATVVQPLSCSVDEDHSHGVHGGEGDSGDQLNKYARTALLVGGMALPVVLSWIVGDDH